MNKTTKKEKEDSGVPGIALLERCVAAHLGAQAATTSARWEQIPAWHQLAELACQECHVPLPIYRTSGFSMG